MLNIVAIQGRLSADPELRTTQTGTPVCSFTLAVQRNIKSGDEYPTDWIDCVAWKGTAEFICKYFQKGQLIAVNGTLQTRSYEKDGVKRKTTQVVVQSAYFCESRNTFSGTQHRAPAARSALPDTSPISQDEMEEILGADDLPF
jgi:single-strand DNA-binding protein